MSVKVLTQANFEDQIAKGVTLVDFWAPWCRPCKIQLSIMKELSEKWEGKAALAKVNVEQEPELSSRYGIMSIPTLLLIKDGEIVDTMVGLHSKEVLEQKLSAV
ncbi:thioredoxin [Desmospora profundinema]|uniref:Thioredoxin n=1 Tax=Desmospora profundinema TaxID=1571184 RepID=A0ABU1IPW7_9BACL|nr:thioredoxin [Desmospora profundinema]MDR6226841.1 thioredoxin 1 [Desmospora profundinema]